MPGPWGQGQEEDKGLDSQLDQVSPCPGHPGVLGPDLALERGAGSPGTPKTRPFTQKYGHWQQLPPSADRDKRVGIGVAQGENKEECGGRGEWQRWGEGT